MVKPVLIRYYSVALCIFISALTNAQIEFEVVRALEGQPAIPVLSAAQKKVSTRSFWRPAGAGLSAGTDGVGFSLISPVSDRFVVRAGVNYADFSIYQWAPDLTRFGLKNSKTVFDITIAQSAVSLVGEWAPWKRKNLRALFGAQYAFQNQYIIKAGYKDTFAFNTITLSPDEIGYVKTTITHGAKLAPFVGIGLGGSIPKNRFGFSFDLGVYYKGKPSAFIEGTGLLDDNADNAARLNKNKAFQSYQWYPVGAVRFIYKFSRR